MEDEKNKCQLCEEIKKDRKFPGCFSDWLNAIASVLIVLIVVLFFAMVFPYKSSEYNKPITNLNSEKLDNVNFNNIVELKLKEFETKIENSQKKRDEDTKFYLTLAGFVLSIVGFFGFKSIHDTRQAAIEKAVFDAKKEAKDEASSVAKKTAIDTVKEEIIGLAKVETNAYLDLNLEKHFEKIETDVLNDFTDRVSKIELDINKLTRPESFNENDRPRIFNDINEELKRLNISIENLKNEMFDFKNEELKKSIISELKKEQK